MENDLPPLDINQLPFSDDFNPSANSSVEFNSNFRPSDAVVVYQGVVWKAKEFKGPKCPKDFVGVPPDCTAIGYLLEPEIIEQCPPGTIGTPGNCTEIKICPPHHVGIPPNCARAPCPPGTGLYQPNCNFTQYFTIKPYTGPPYVPCPAGQVGTPPFCHIPCPGHGKCNIRIE